MDLSKLPKLSGDREPPPAPGHAGALGPGTTEPIPYARANPGGVAEGWLSLAIGGIILALSPRLIQFLLSPSTFAQKWTFNDGGGNPLPYPRTVYFWGDVVLTAFAVALMIE